MEVLLKREKQPTLLGVNLVYLIVLLLMIGSQVILASWIPETSEGADYYWKLLIMEFVLIGLPALIYMLIFRMDIRKVIRLNPIKPGEGLLVLGMAIFGYWVMIIINLIWYWIVSHLGTPVGQHLPDIQNEKQLLAAVAVIGFVPALVEEFLFRGLILRGYEKFGSKVAIVMTGILFGMLHIQLLSIPSIILIGIIISYVVYRTNSILAGIIYHFVHNGMTVFFLFVQNLLIGNPEMAQQLPQDISQIPHDDLSVAFVVWGIIGFFALILFAGCVITLHIYTRGKGQVRAVSLEETRRLSIVEMLPAFAAMIIIIVNIIFEILYMMGKTNI
ncbi:MAG: type II CAAX endopeptidase family protein [Caldicoprobacterales bacterium]|jgi:membrane protease YdiL (CAAX protease family)|nr:CPBP family intramembrane metalloprotease [Clostridiales bacterium]